MKKNPRFILWLIIALTISAIFVNLPHKGLSFRKGLDLAGGTTITFKADMSGIPTSQQIKALDAAKTVVEKRVNLFGVSEPVIQTAVSKDFRIIVELPGVDINQAKSIIGTTAQLSFWEQGDVPVDASQGANKYMALATNSAYPLGLGKSLGPNPKKTNLSGRDLSETSVTFDPNTGKPQVSLSFTKEGAEKFADITKRNVNKIVAIVLDNTVIEAPRVNQPILNGNAVITGSFTPESAKALSTALNAGALPVPLVPIQQHSVSPTLGSDSLQKSLFAGVLGLVIIVVFMSVLYGVPGVLASLALLLYTLLVLSIFRLSSLTPYGITITLSGIAGFVLSIGMAVDANILIFERMKEEQRLNKPKEVVLALGFSRAWTSIRDSNISTLITSAILYKFGNGMIRGFALVLAIGVLVSMFSAIVVTRTLLRIVYRS